MDFMMPRTAAEEKELDTVLDLAYAKVSVKSYSGCVSRERKSRTKFFWGVR
jgi:hypothetical protein